MDLYGVTDVDLDVPKDQQVIRSFAWSVVEEAGEAIELYDAAGNCYLFDPATGSLTPCDAPMEGGDMPSDPTQAPVDPTQAAEPAPVEEGYAKPMHESTEVTPAPATTVVEESTVVAEQATQIIEESTAPAQLSVVNRILANIK